MVKKIFNVSILSIILGAFLLTSCSNDFAGVVASNDLDERLISKNDFPFLSRYADNSALEPVLPDTFKFIIVTDTHMEDGDDFGLMGINEAVKKHNASFVINLGDITQHGTAHDIDLFIKIADSLDVPFYPVIGNHDFYFGNWPVWRDKIGSTKYRIDIKDLSDKYHTTLLVLDTGNAFFGRKQLDWLEFELKTAHKNVFVFTHAALFTTGIKMQQVTDTRERARVASILKNKADIMFSGHSHQRAVNEAGNVRYITFEDFKSTGIYIIAHVKPTGVTYKFDKLKN